MFTSLNVVIKMILKGVCLLMLVCVGSARAATILDLPGDELLRQAEILRVQLNLAATQSVPWLQAAAKSREILREQKARRERFQIETKDKIAGGRFSVKSAIEGADAEDTATQDDRRRLVELWGGVLADVRIIRIAEWCEFGGDAPLPTLSWPPILRRAVRLARNTPVAAAGGFRCCWSIPAAR